MPDDTINYLMAQEMYNALHLYEGDKNDVPFWNLSDREVEYYKWLFSKDEYSELKKSVSQKLK
jgi:hypothetical protein